MNAYLLRRVGSIVIVTLMLCDASSDETTLMIRLTSQGVLFADDQQQVLASPSLEGVSNEQDRISAVTQVAGGIGWKRFSRDSKVAPIEIDMEYVKDSEGNRVGHLVYVAFVLHADIDLLRDQQRMEELLSGVGDETESGQYSAQEIGSDELARIGVDRTDESNKYFQFRMPLLDRVLVQGVVHSEFTDDGDVAISWILDPRFRSDGKSIGNRWSRLEPGDAGEEPKPYQGAGGYLYISPLTEPAGACFVEARMAIHEPSEWFRGSNLLRSKLPLMIQESVRKLRRELDSNDD